MSRCFKRQSEQQHRRVSCAGLAPPMSRRLHGSVAVEQCRVVVLTPADRWGALWLGVSDGQFWGILCFWHDLMNEECIAALILYSVQFQSAPYVLAGASSFSCLISRKSSLCCYGLTPFGNVSRRTIRWKDACWGVTRGLFYCMHLFPA
jgi:hypothetical protein